MYIVIILITIVHDQEFNFSLTDKKNTSEF